MIFKTIRNNRDSLIVTIDVIGIAQKSRINAEKQPFIKATIGLKILHFIPYEIYINDSNSCTVHASNFLKSQK